MKTVVHTWVEAARNSQNPNVILKVPSGWAVLGDAQFLEGYSLLLPDPVVSSINDLSMKEREVFFRDYSLLGDAVLKSTGALRINYEILGNVEPALHAHVFPRFSDEPEELRKKPVWFYDFESGVKFDETKHKNLKLNIQLNLIDLYRKLNVPIT